MESSSSHRGHGRRTACPPASGGMATPPRSTCGLFVFDSARGDMDEQITAVRHRLAPHCLVVHSEGMTLSSML